MFVVVIGGRFRVMISGARGSIIGVLIGRRGWLVVATSSSNMGGWGKRSGVGHGLRLGTQSVFFK